MGYRPGAARVSAFGALLFVLLFLAGSAIAVAAAKEQDSPANSVQLHTAQIELSVSPSSRTSGLYYFGEGLDYLRDGSLIIGTSANDLSMLIYSDSLGNAGDPAIGPLYGLGEISIDSTSSSSYRHAWGKGCNRDSSIGFDIDFFAPKSTDSAEFVLGVVKFYAGDKNPDATISGVTIAYAADFDVPDAAGANAGGIDEARSVFYQRGVNGTGNTRFAGIAAYRDDYAQIDGGVILDNATWVNGHGGYQHDSIWQKIQTAQGFETFQGTPTDLNTILTIGRNITIRPKSTGVFTIYLFLATQPEGGTLNELQFHFDMAKVFICSHVITYGLFCMEHWNCGDANSDDFFDISDAVFLIQYIFAGGPAPATCMYPLGRGDANGDCAVDVSDAVFLIQYIFAGGPAPACGYGCQ